jgi:hypothetical protein
MLRIYLILNEFIMAILILYWLIKKIYM